MATGQSVPKVRKVLFRTLSATSSVFSRGHFSIQCTRTWRRHCMNLRAEREWNEGYPANWNGYDSVDIFDYGDARKVCKILNIKLLHFVTNILLANFGRLVFWNYPRLNNPGDRYPENWKKSETVTWNKKQIFHLNSYHPFFGVKRGEKNEITFTAFMTNR